MALFCIRRYGEQDGQEAEEEAQGRARVLLERLQRQARARQQKKQREAPAPGREGPGGEPGERKGSRESEEQPSAQRQKKVKTKQPRSSSEERAGTEEAADGSSPTKKKKAHRRKSKVQRESTEADSEEDIKQDSRNNFKKKPNKRRKTDEETQGDEAGKKESSGKAEGNKAAEEELPLAAPGEGAGAAPSSMMILGDYEAKPVQKVQPFLPQWLAEPRRVQKSIRDNLSAATDVPGIHPLLLRKLHTNGIDSFFPVQAEVIPAILGSAAGGFLRGRGGYRPRDICVSAPTGSGKTLAFVIPIVQVLLDRVVCHVRALVVLPTKELAQQVSKVFNIYTDGTGLKVVLITGQKSFAKEQEMLVQKKVTGYCSLADIVVATPGRLTDHISQTPGFSLAQLRFLIVDEADRMIDDMHQNCLNQIVKAAFQGENYSGSSTLFQRTKPGPLTAASSCSPQIPLQKLLFSATLTQDPEKLQQLDLFQPRLFTSVYSEKNRDGAEAEQNTNNKYTLPEGLSQCYVPCDLNSKPLLLLYFMLKMKFTRVLCFTNSREASHRLFLLVQAFGGVTVAEFSSRLTPNERRRTMKEFDQGKIQLLISTDATARGIDVKGVNYVINYDAPQFIRTYIHRVGRTARAGEAGVAFSLVLRIQERRFLRMLRDAGIQDIKKHPVKGNSLKPMVQQYEEALSKLEKTVKNERAQKRA
ncbi:ATP-dependent RNA helicase DDX51 isoform X2 [Passer montanus]|uniref:ATP-dependent RNA helicase DDX51 isoform X1 n=2 Tax=Passer montanus TaxID=9160 RepID=UPI0019607977|nr:ATP-dependent RNA helicase DDX51 isoform X1 [Passer montanus]XP_039581982.1 ATP-dependent RNA helicase DDX51 isoform X2 [Passer montanus]